MRLHISRAISMVVVPPVREHVDAVPFIDWELFKLLRVYLTNLT